MKTFGNVLVRIVLGVMILFPSVSLLAQSNLREGYVITLQGDTLHGDIDFRTAEMNMKKCVFFQDGTTSSKTYLPGEIQGYRYLNNGIYYVSKEIDTPDEGRKVVFAEYVVRGNMNLYQVGLEEMVLEDDEGHQEYYYPHQVERSSSVKEKKQGMKGALTALNKSPKATHYILKNVKDRKHTREAVVLYIDEVCTDGYCEVFEYKNPITPKEDRLFHPWIKAGFKVTSYEFWNGRSITGTAPRFELGVDCHLNRIIRGLMLNIGVSYEYGKASKSIDDLFKGKRTREFGAEKPSYVDFQQLDVLIGPGYQRQIGALMVNAKGGFILRAVSHDFDYKRVIYNCYGEELYIFGEGEHSFRFDAQYGFYASTGVEYPLKKCSLICDLEYIYDYNKWTKIHDDVPAKTIVKQRGVCLSAGVKF